MSSKLDLFINEFRKIKKSYNFDVVDVHVHPFDVMGVIHFSDHKTIDAQRFDKLDISPNALERLRFGPIVNLFAEIFCRLTPKQVNNEIKNSFTNVNTARIITEMDQSLVDHCFLVPIEPWSRTIDITRSFRNKRFSYVGSIDIQAIKEGNIEATICRMKEELNIVGLKLHPNLQNFYPQPRMNKNDIANKLHKILSITSKLKLFLMIHGGRSFFTNQMDTRYGQRFRGKDNGLLVNFIDQGGESELFSSYRMPIIICHAAHYGALSFDSERIDLIRRKYPNVFFDTAGTSPKVILKMLRLVGYKRIVFGSDALYNSMMFNLLFLFRATRIYARR